MYVSRVNASDFAKLPVSSKEEKKRNIKLACKTCTGTQIVEKAKTTR